MKALGIFIGVSLAANVALIAILFAGRNSSSDTTSATAGVERSTVAAAPGQEPIGPVWDSLRGEEVGATVQKLRENGFPPHIVRAITYARVQELFAPRLKALRPDAASLPYWKNATVDPRIRVAEQQLYREQQKMLRDLLGADAEQPERSLFDRTRLDHLPPEKHQAVRDAVRMMEDKRQDLFTTISAAGGVITISDDVRQKMKTIEEDLYANLGTILTPAEVEEYKIRNSEVSNNLRFELSAFNPSEDEFRSIYKIWSQLEQPTSGMSQEEMQRRFNAQRLARDQIKAQLGPERGAEYERAVDHSYRQTSQLVSRLELPPETTTKVWDVKTDIEKRANEIRRDTALPSAERTKQLAALAEEGTTRVASLVGPRGIEAYKTQGGGFWLQNLVPRPAPGAPPPR
jgi:hypothetical protein